GGEKQVDGILTLGAHEVVIDRRHQRTEYHGKPQDDAAAQGYAQVAHTQPIGQPADTPKQAEQERIAQRTAIGLPDDIGKAGDGNIGGQRRHDKPREQSTDNPKALPSPAFHLLIRHTKTPRGKHADEMEKYSRKGMQIKYDENWTIGK